MNVQCIFCRSIKNKVIFREFDIDVVKCTKCGHIFSAYYRDQNYNNYWGIKELILTEDFFWVNQAHIKIYDDFCQKFIVGNSGRLLDIGCGTGFFLQKIANFPQWDAFGYEISEVAVNFAKDKLGIKKVFQGRIEDSNFEKESFDIITLWDVIEHIPDPMPLLRCARTLLKDNGILFIHTPNVKVILPIAKLTKLIFGMKDNFHYLEAKNHINLYSKKTILKLLNYNNFNQVEFIHLKPIQSIAGSKSQFFSLLKNIYFYFSVILYWLTFKKINIDNLFVVAKKY